MEHKRLFLSLLMTIAGVMISEKSLAGNYSEESLPIVVKNINEWSKEFPTVINNWNGMLTTSISGTLPPVLSVITSINGISTNGMTQEHFNELLMSSDKSTIEFEKKEQGGYVKDKCTISYNRNIYWAEGINMEYPEEFPDNVNLKSSKNTQFYKINSFSYIIGSDTGLDEYAILEVAGRVLSAKGLVKLENGEADIVLSLNTGKDQWNGNTVILNIYDGKKMKQGIKQSIWSLEINSLKKDMKANLSTIKTVIYNYSVNYPFDVPIFSHKITTLGIGFKSEDAVGTGQVIKVLQGTDAYEKGLRDGDMILSAYLGGQWIIPLPYFAGRKYWFKANHRPNQKLWSFMWFIIPFPFYTKNHSDHYLVMSEGFDVSNRNHFKVKKKDGRKIKMDAPFKKQTFNFIYMR